MRMLIVVLAVCLLLSPIVMDGQRVRGDTATYYVSLETVSLGGSDGFDKEQEEDSSSNVKWETGTTTSDAWEKPASTEASGWVAEGCSEIYEYQCLDDDPVHDENTTYVWLNCEASPPCYGAGYYGHYTITDVPLEAMAWVFVSVTAWVHALKESNDAFSVSFQLKTGPSWCAPQLATLTLDWVNSTYEYDQDCYGTAWDYSAVRLMTFYLNYSYALVDLDKTKVTSIGASVEYYTDLQLDFTSIIVIPTEQVENVKIVTEGDLTGDTDEGFVIEIGGEEVTDTAYKSGYTRLEFDTSLRGEVNIRIYGADGGDWGNTVLSLDALYAIVETSSGGSGLKAPEPICEYQPLGHCFRCIDMQDYGLMKVVWIRWKLDGQPSVQGNVGEPVILSGGITSWGRERHVLTAVAVYESGAEMMTQMHIESDNGLWIGIMFMLGLLAFVFVAAIAIYESEKKRRKRGRE